MAREAVLPSRYAGVVADEPIVLPNDLVASVRELVGVDGVTDYLVKAVERMLKNQELARILDELEAEAGSVPEGLTAEAEAFWRAS